MPDRMKETTSRNATQKKTAKKKAAKKIRKDAKPTSYFEAVTGGRLSEIEAEAALWITQFNMRLEQIAAESPSDESSKERTVLMAEAKKKVWSYFLMDLAAPESGAIAALGRAIKEFIGSGGNVRMEYMVSFLIKMELEDGSREKPPTSMEFREELKSFNVDEPDSRNRYKLAKHADWEPTPGRRGRPRKNT